MGKDIKIREALNRVIKVFKKRPEKTLSTNHASAVVRDGLKCTFTQGEQNAIMDMPDIMGGDDAGPTPGFFARAGIAGCVSMGIKQAAILEGLVFDKVTVEIETDFDDGAMFGLGTASAAPLETRLAIRIETDVPEADVSTLIDKVLGMDPWFLALQDKQSVNTQVIVEG